MQALTPVPFTPLHVERTWQNAGINTTLIVERTWQNAGFQLWDYSEIVEREGKDTTHRRSYFLLQSVLKEHDKMKI